jgi:hypothetical protein
MIMSNRCSQLLAVSKYTVTDKVGPAQIDILRLMRVRGPVLFHESMLACSKL